MVDTAGRPIDRTPPKPGQTTRRHKPDGNQEYWCEKCPRWGNHDTDHHDAFMERMKLRAQKRQQGKQDQSATSAAANVSQASDKPTENDTNTQRVTFATVARGRPSLRMDAELVEAFDGIEI